MFNFKIYICNKNIFFIVQVEGSILRIENIQVRDRGVYMCEVRGPGGTSRSQSVIEVERKSFSSTKNTKI